MHLRNYLFATAAIATTANAVHLTNTYFGGIAAARAFNITWDEAEGPVEVFLMRAQVWGLQHIYPIVLDSTDNEAVWIPREDLCAGEYVLKIVDEMHAPNFSQKFNLTYGFSGEDVCEYLMDSSSEDALNSTAPTSDVTSTSASSAQDTAASTTAECSSSSGLSSCSLPSLSVRNWVGATPRAAVVTSVTVVPITTIAVGPMPSTDSENVTMAVVATYRFRIQNSGTSKNKNPAKEVGLEAGLSLGAMALAFLAAFGMH
ncbi:hypothetical protein PVAG01_10652 [Phlyctema vagabunda]|uniref:Uncharacterized protein n=1 Tax=Phlyctema vagabunda TaxID=108571 RepID=A0ABR4P2W5_9HELO